MGKKGPVAKPTPALFKMAPKTAEFVAVMEEGTPKQKEVAKAVREKNEGKKPEGKNKEDVTGSDIMTRDYAAKMGGYGNKPIKMQGVPNLGKNA